ncbi:MAG: hypothetical protein GC191_19205 [Azospirillum sp.]|nr:hypothetical protein [Azospirillum sp.]
MTTTAITIATEPRLDTPATQVLVLTATPARPCAQFVASAGPDDPPFLPRGGVLRGGNWRQQSGSRGQPMTKLAMHSLGMVAVTAFVLGSAPASARDATGDARSDLQHYSGYLDDARDAVDGNHFSVADEYSERADGHRRTPLELRSCGA